MGTPQGSVLSSLLANVVLHELDVFMTKDLGSIYNVGKARRRNSEHRKASYSIEKLKKGWEFEKYGGDLALRRKTLRKAASHQRKFPYYDLMDANFKRFTYVRYADDWIVLLIGTKASSF